MQYESFTDLDEIVIVKLGSYYEGNIFIDDDLIARCKFDTYLVPLDISNKTKIDLSTLFDQFEDEFSETYGQLIEFYEVDDYLSIVRDILNSITNKRVLRFCNKYLKLIESTDDLQSRIDLLNQLDAHSKLDPENLPLPKEDCIYQTTRSLFPFHNRTSKEVDYRFTIAKKVLAYMRSESDYLIRIDLVHSNLKIRFQVIQDPVLDEWELLDSRAMFSNNDGSTRINLPRITYVLLSEITAVNGFSIKIDGDDIQFYQLIG